MHWKVSNSQALANCFTHDELWNRRIAIDALGSAAAGVDAANALLLALVHRAGHHRGSTNLLWLYNFHLLSSRLTAAELQRVHDVAAARGLNDIAVEGLAVANGWFGETTAEPTLPSQQPFTLAQILRLDLQALPDWRTRMHLIREHVLPPANYMRAKYGARSHIALSALYFWRVLHGMPKWFRHTDAGRFS